MNDQVSNLKKRGIKAIALTSALSKREIDIALDNCIYGEVKFLFVSPERLKSHLFIERFKKMNLNLIAVDESHCISQWGYDFRPAYLEIAEVRKHHPNIPLLALTATATKKVAEDISKKLEFKKENLISGSFHRPNLSFNVIEAQDKLNSLIKILRTNEGSGIVYCRNRRKCQEIAQLLDENNYSVDYYHAGLSNEIRAQKQKNWFSGAKAIMVATNAFGMGIDKSDVRFVVNFDLPPNLESFVQESGRAGRDEQHAKSFLLFQKTDIDEANTKLIDQFPDRKIVTKVYDLICNELNIAFGSGEGEQYPIDIYNLRGKGDLKAVQIHHALQIIEKAEYFQLSDAFNIKSRLKFIVPKQDLYDFQVRHPKIGIFMKSLMRVYGGLFEDYVAISEGDVARKLKTNTKAIQQRLTQMAEMEIVDYIPNSGLPLLTFTQPRAITKNVRIPRSILEDRKKDAVSRLNEMIYFIETKTCRSRVMRKYFGEKVDSDCGICDNCTGKEQTLSKKDFDLLSTEITSIVNKNPIRLNDLVDAIGNYSEDSIVRVTSHLIDNAIISFDERNCLTIN